MRSCCRHILLYALVIFSASISFAQSTEPDPFAGVSPKETPEAKSTGFFSDNFGFRKELMSEFGATNAGQLASRQSAGFEVIKKFSTETKTFLGIDFQGRLVWREGFVDSPNDHEGMNRQGVVFEYHNAYADLYSLFGDVGRFNLRLGRFYLPFGLNLQTDTHGTLLQLSNERNFGFERDWYAGFWGILTEDLRYDVYYMLGSGYGINFAGQSGLGAARVGLANKYLSDYGLEAGASFMGGQRLSPNIINTLRGGLDARYRKSIPTGLLTLTSEVSAGQDSPNAVVTQLYQLDYLHSSRRFGVASQFRWFWEQNLPKPVDSAILAEATWYFSNDISGSNLQWIKLNCEVQLARQTGDRNVIWTLQYYWYW